MRYLTDPRLRAVSEKLRALREVIVFTSSKGGVGKTLVSVTTALLLARRGIRPGLLDMDITNPNAHLVLGIDPSATKPLEERGLMPPKISGIRFMSPVFFTYGRPAPLRGEGVSSAIREILAITRWEEVDVLIVDTPPGMGDEMLELLTYIRRFRSFVIATPSPLALESAARLADVLGPSIEAIVLNMSPNDAQQLDRLVGRHSTTPIYRLPYDPEVDSAIGYPNKLITTAFAREVDRQVVEHLVRLVGVRPYV